MKQAEIVGLTTYCLVCAHFGISNNSDSLKQYFKSIRDKAFFRITYCQKQTVMNKINKLEATILFQESIFKPLNDECIHSPKAGKSILMRTPTTQHILTYQSELTPIHIHQSYNSIIAYITIVPILFI